jgi:hypothetical protein
MQVNDKKIKHALIKVGLTPNRIFGLCDIKTSSWSTFSLSKFPDMMSLDEYCSKKQRKTMIFSVLV